MQISQINKKKHQNFPISYLKQLHFSLLYLLWQEFFSNSCVEKLLINLDFLIVVDQERDNAVLCQKFPLS